MSCNSIEWTKIWSALLFSHSAGKDSIDFNKDISLAWQIINIKAQYNLICVDGSLMNHRYDRCGTSLTPGLDLWQ